jgi:hypothetical protein
MGLSRLKLVLPAPPAPDPTPIVDIEATRQSPVPSVPDATPLDVETTRQRPVPRAPDPRPTCRCGTTRQRPVPGTPDATPLVDVETTRQRPSLVHRMRLRSSMWRRRVSVPRLALRTPLRLSTWRPRASAVPRAPDPTPLVDVEQPASAHACRGRVGGTVVRRAPAVQSERTTCGRSPPRAGMGRRRGLPRPRRAAPHRRRWARGLPASVVAIVAVVVILAAVGIALASNLTSSRALMRSRRRSSPPATTAPQQGRVEVSRAASRVGCWVPGR